MCEKMCLHTVKYDPILKSVYCKQAQTEKFLNKLKSEGYRQEAITFEKNTML